MAEVRYWTGDVPAEDDFGVEIKDVFVDGRTVQGPWAFMAPASWRMYGVGAYGTGYGQRYVKAANGKWMKVEG
jgi:hypothetical protein